MKDTERCMMGGWYRCWESSQSHTNTQGALENTHIVGMGVVGDVRGDGASNRGQGHGRDTAGSGERSPGQTERTCCHLTESLSLIFFTRF